MTFSQLWDLKVQIIPVLIGAIIVELPNFIRRYKKVYYIPIYFNLFPLRALNPNLAVYLGEDYYVLKGVALENNELEGLKKRIMINSLVSMLLSAIVIPLLGGFLLAFFQNEDIFLHSTISICIYKLYRIIIDIIGFKGHAIASRRNVIILSVIYFFYLGVFIQLLNNAYAWAHPYVFKKDYQGLFVSLSDIIFTKALVQGLVLTALAAYFGNLLTDKKIRDENIERIRGTNSSEHKSSDDTEK